MDITIAIPKELHKRLKIRAVEKEMTVREAATIAVLEWLRKKEGK